MTFKFLTSDLELCRYVAIPYFYRIYFHQLILDLFPSAFLLEL